MVWYGIKLWFDNNYDVRYFVGYFGSYSYS